MEIYFVVLKLPGSEELKFTEGNHSPENFWNKAHHHINEGNSPIVSIRQDTGISEELRQRAERSNGFETYFLFYLTLEREETRDEKLIRKKAADLLKVANYEAVIEANDDFQLVTLDYLENNESPVNLNGRGSAWSA